MCGYRKPLVCSSVFLKLRWDWKSERRSFSTCQNSHPHRLGIMSNIFGWRSCKDGILSALWVYSTVNHYQVFTTITWVARWKIDGAFLSLNAECLYRHRLFCKAARRFILQNSYSTGDKICRLQVLRSEGHANRTFFVTDWDYLRL